MSGLESVIVLLSVMFIIPPQPCAGPVYQHISDITVNDDDDDEQSQQRQQQQQLQLQLQRLL